jgi:hypothetical protein
MHDCTSPCGPIRATGRNAAHPSVERPHTRICPTAIIVNIRIRGLRPSAMPGASALLPRAAGSWARRKSPERLPIVQRRDDPRDKQGVMIRIATRLAASGATRIRNTTMGLFGHGSRVRSTKHRLIFLAGPSFAPARCATCGIRHATATRAKRRLLCIPAAPRTTAAYTTSRVSTVTPMR